MTRKHLEFSSGTSDKFWTIELTGSSHTVTFGRIGTDGQSQRKKFKTDELAKKSFDKLVSQKLKKGYEEKKWKQPSGKSTTTRRTKSADRFALDAVFKSLRKQGIISLHNAGYTLSDGFEDAMSAFERHRNPDQVVGICYYHQQDSGGAKDGHGLHLAFGTARAEDEKQLAVKVGKTIRDELEKAGFKVVWNGKLSQRIYLPDFAWFAPTTEKKKVKTTRKAAAKKKPVSKKSARKAGAKVGSWATGRKREFERSGKTASELATIQVDGKQLVVWRGKAGAKGRTTKRKFKTTNEALSEYARVINSDLMLKKYVECGKESEHFILKVRALPKLAKAKHIALLKSYQKLIPKSGQADSIHGELFRCVAVLQEQAASDNENWERGHRMMLDFLHTHLLSRCFSFTRRDNPVEHLLKIKKVSQKGKSASKADFEKLSTWVLCWCRAHPNLIPHTKNPKLPV